MTRILIVGEGYLGTRFAKEIPGAILRACDIASPASVRAVLEGTRPDVVINAAGKAGKKNVDDCEWNKTETYRSNVVGPLVLVEECEKRKIHLIHLSSGCIFYGPSPKPGGWRETDFPNPVSFYSKTKAAADSILAELSHVAVVRLRMPVDYIPHPRNLISKLASYPFVVDAKNSVTMVDDLVAVVRQMVERRLDGVYHVVNLGVVAHRDILRLYREFVDPKHRCEFVSETELEDRGLIAKQRSHCVLASERLQAAGISMRPAGEALREVMKKYAEEMNK